MDLVTIGVAILGAVVSGVGSFLQAKAQQKAAKKLAAAEKARTDLEARKQRQQLLRDLRMRNASMLLSLGQSSGATGFSSVTDFVQSQFSTEKNARDQIQQGVNANNAASDAKVASVPSPGLAGGLGAIGGFMNAGGGGVVSAGASIFSGGGNDTISGGY